MKRNRIFGQWIVLMSLVLFAMRPGAAATVGVPAGLQPAFTEADIDWENTTEFPVNPAVAGFAKSREDQILRCIGLRSPGATHGAWRAGEATPETSGQPAYCRLAFKQPVTIGTIIQGSAAEVWMEQLRTFAGARVSILKSTVTFPGDINNDENWDQVAILEPMGGAAVFVLPANTQVRAVRMTAPVAATRFFAGRFTDLAAGARFNASSGDAKSLREGNGWIVKLQEPISPDNPQWLISSWDKSRAIRGIVLYQPSFSECRVEVYQGTPGTDPLSAPASNWKTIAARTFSAPWRAFQNAVIEFDKEIETTAVRLVVTQPWTRPNEDVAAWFGGQGHACGLTGLAILSDVGLIPKPAAKTDSSLNIHGETPLPDRLAVWADEAIRPLQLDALDQGAIPINISLDAPGYVTLVVEDEQGKRVRNLVSERFLKAGQHVIGWDGLDEAGIPAVTQGAYDSFPNLVHPGQYRVRGLVRGPINLRYEFSANTAGNPPWRMPDGTGGWLADHTPPSALVFLPGDKPRMLIGSFIAEAGDGLVWTDLTGRKLAGTRSIGAGGGWCGAYLLARDSTPGAPEAYLTAAKDSIELWSINPHRNVLGKQRIDGKSVQGIAARNGLVALSIDVENKLLLVDAASGKILATPALERPRGLAFDDAGKLLVISGDKLLRFALPQRAADMKLPEADVVIATGLKDASQFAMDPNGNFFVSVHGDLHQVKVFGPDGKFVRVIGEPGGARVGPYDPRRMDKPTGLAITPNGHLWVAENSFSPKRVSIWTLDGQLVKWMVGPSQYGGGGSLSADKQRFYYGGQQQAGLEFAVDMATGTAQLSNIYYLPGGPGDIGVEPGGGNWQNLPQHPITVGGREYMVNAWNSHATRGVNSLTIWQKRDSLALPVAAIGRPGDLGLLSQGEFQARRQSEGNDLFAWSDQNDDGKIQPDEVTFTPKFEKQGPLGQTSIGPDLTVINANGLVFRPQGFTAAGAPIYDAAKAELLVEGLMTDVGAAGGGQPVLGADGNFIVTGGPMRGFRNGRLAWTYPSRWPSLDAAHWGNKQKIARIAPPAPGLMVGTTHLCGPTVTPRGGEAGELWAINGNVGSVYLMTVDGLFVATLFPDVRLQKLGAIPAKRGTLLNDMTPGAESFWTSVSQTADGEVYLVAEVVAARGRQSQSSVIHVDGLQTVRRIPATPITVTPSHLAACQEHLITRAATQIEKAGRQVYRVAISDAVHVVDGDLKEWPAAWAKNASPLPPTGRPGGWIQLGELPYHHKWWPILGAARIAGNQLHIAVTVPRFCLALDPLQATDADPTRLLTAASAVEIALGTDPAADEARTQPAAGDIRVLVSVHNGQPLAVLYRGAESEVISGNVQVGQTPNSYEVAIPLAALGIEPKPGTTLRADFGITQRPYRVLDATGRKLRVAAGTMNVAGHDERVRRHYYWHNKATTVAEDPALRPQLWGTWKFE